jgi:predicted metalloprotease
MRWMGGRQSENVEDRRGIGGPLVVSGGIGTVVVVLLALFFGFDPSVILQGDAPTAPPATQQAPSPSSRGQDELRAFVATVLADTEDTWRALFTRMGREYRDPKLVLFSSAVQSACGIAGSATGPFYCPQDQKVYLDLDFFRALRDRFHAPGDFAQAYVIAHEVGHHVQNLLGISDRVMAERRRGGAQANAASVRLELQADCLAGVWGHHAERARHILEVGDVEEALGAASAIGDDRLQRQTQGRVAPETFTHGTSKQRVHWFTRGIESGDLRQCDTFGGPV